MLYRKWIVALGLASFFGLAAQAQEIEWYTGASVGFLNQSDSDNSGATEAFTTGNIGDGTTIDVAAGTRYGWTTEFDSGYAFSLEGGFKYNSNWRSGIEIVTTQADVDTHTGVTLGGGDIGSLDAAALTGSATPLGASIADVVADGQGDITTVGIFANGYYTFDRGQAFKPYVGVGIGYIEVDVTYAPSGVGIIDDSEGEFAYQVKLGASYELSDAWEVYGEYAYRDSDAVGFANTLFPGTLEVETQQNVFSLGARFTFGR